MERDPSTSQQFSNSDEEPNQDIILLEKFRNGDEEAATSLFHRYVRRIAHVAQKQCATELQSRLDSDDVIQSVFRTFFRRVATGQYQVPSGEELWKLLVVITLNKIRSLGEHHRAAKRDIRSTTSGEDWIAQSQDLHAGQELTELRLLIEEILNKLPETQQKMVQLRLEGHEFKEIAEQVGRSKRSVERVLHDFRLLLRKKIDEGWEG